MCIFKPKTRETHHVFISFCGDTRSGFTSHLEASFTRHGIVPFLDHKIDRGDKMFPTLLREIKRSRISVVVFSKEYASSEWCLDELVTLMECNRKSEQIVIPFFYGVKPKELREQSGNYAAAFAEHEQSYGRRRVKRWRRALTKAADVSGWDRSSYGTEFGLVGDIAIDVKNKLE
ncbi:disease resistance protein RLM3-like [Neltuma alba]|uniref:disease resistance protein RLM3-like n=1 Tax=Neltuma alba TaxID=207710 RepID=UPI0010A4C785|nr:disease resistance protein RLM3-like [Prosopis alba]